MTFLGLFLAHAGMARTMPPEAAYASICSPHTQG